MLRTLKINMQYLHKIFFMSLLVVGKITLMPLKRLLAKQVNKITVVLAIIFANLLVIYK